MKKFSKLIAIFTTLMALTFTACQHEAPSPEPTTTGGTDKLPIFYATIDNLQDVIDSLNSNSTIIITGTLTDNEIETMKGKINSSGYMIKLDLQNVTGLESIPRYGFYNCSKLETISLPNSLTTIGDGAFHGAKNLVEINIPNSLTTIEEYAFSNCESLKRISIPASVTSIERYPFRYCTSLTEIKVDSKNQNYISVDGVLFDKSKTSLLAYPCGKTDKSYSIPDSVSTIVQGAFEKCNNLTTVIIPNSVTCIENYAFEYCSNLKSIIIPNSVTTIEQFTFTYCSNLSNITIPNSVTSIEWCAFAECISLEEIILPDSLTAIETGAFSNCDSLKTITIPASVSSISSSAFGGCDSLLSINVDPNSNYFTSEEGVLFNKAKSTLITYPCGKTDSSYTIPDSVTIIEWYAFESCNNLTNVIIPNSVTRIGDSSFSHCKKLSTIAIPNSVTNILSYAFSNCTDLTTVTIGSGAIRISNYVFSNCSKLTSITFATPTGWLGTTNVNYRNGTSIDLSNPQDNATYFTDTYRNYYWYK